MSSQTALLATLALIAGLGLLFWAVINAVVRRSENEAESRLRELLSQEMGNQQHPVLENGKREKVKRSSSVNTVAGWIDSSEMMASAEGRSFLQKVEEELTLAGLNTRYTPQQGIAIALLIWFCGVALPTVMFFTMGLNKIIYAMCVALFAAYPLLKLRQLKASRQDSIKGELPIFIQQLAMTVSASGATLDEAITRTVHSAELDPYDSILAREFGQALTEYTLGGVDREQALRGVSYRTGVVGVMNLVEAIIQGWRTGTPMDEVLETYAVKARELWRQDMRTFKARKEPIITFGLVITMVGGFIWIASPMLINLMSTIKGIG